MYVCLDKKNDDDDNNNDFFRLVFTLHDYFLILYSLKKIACIQVVYSLHYDVSELWSAAWQVAVNSSTRFATSVWVSEQSCYIVFLSKQNKKGREAAVI